MNRRGAVNTNINQGRLLHHFSGDSIRNQTAVEHHSNELNNKPDLVFVRELYVKALTGVDAWQRPQPQPVSISIWLQTSVAQAGTTDHLVYSLNYDVISRKITRMVEGGKFKSLEEIADNVGNEVLKDSAIGQWCKIHVKKPRALLRAGAAEIIVTRKKKPLSSSNSISGEEGYEIVPADGTTDVVLIQKLQLTTIIGVNTIERLHKQNVVIDLTLYRPTGRKYNKRYDFRECVDAVESHVEDSSYKTVEAFVTSVAEVVCRFGVDKVTVRAEKPSAITFADAAGVEITRDRAYFKKALNSALASGSTTPQLRNEHKATIPLFPQSGGKGPVGTGEHTVYIAFGSNMGDSVTNIRQAIGELNKRGIEVVNTSTLYESDPMYVTEQDKFVNGVVKAKTLLKPLELLDELKDIESNELNRVKLIENGPRSIDLDILLYDDLVMNHPRLDIPHVGMLSRSFVLQPLAELISPDETHPLTAESYHQHLEEIFKQDTDPNVQVSSRLKSLIPFGDSKRKLNLDPTHQSTPTQIMAILNVTPDSFSDGGELTLDNIVSKARKHVSNGATILDIGGASSAPNSTDPGVEEEINRVVPAIKAIRKLEEFDNIAISIDTYRANVARVALEAGADIINDISAGVMDNEMFNVAKELKAPIILNHTRGTPQEMTKLATYISEKYKKDSPDAVIEQVAYELEQRVEEAVKAGLPRWQLILDPGIGFAKNMPHNLAIIRYFNELRHRSHSFTGIPWLVGPSRKKFIGKLTGKEAVANDRVYGTAAAVTALVSGGADIVRVHDVEEMSQVVKVSDALYRN